MMLITRSGGIVPLVCSTGMVAPSGSCSADLPGSQLMKYSPISDCGSTLQKTSLRKDPKPSRLMSTVISARPVERWTSSVGDLPDADAGGLEVGPRGEAERVVEDDLELLAALLARRAQRPASPTPSVAAIAQMIPRRLMARPAPGCGRS